MSDCQTYETYLRQQVKKGQYGVAIIRNDIALGIADYIENNRTPEREKGEWILFDNQRVEDTDAGNYLYICSKCCHSDVHSKHLEVPYCWYCGAKMEARDETD